MRGPRLRASVHCPLTVLLAGQSRAHACCPGSGTCRCHVQRQLAELRGLCPRQGGRVHAGGTEFTPGGAEPMWMGHVPYSHHCPHLGSLSTLVATPSVRGRVQTWATRREGLTPGPRCQLPVCGRPVPSKDPGQSLGSPDSWPEGRAHEPEQEVRPQRSCWEGGFASDSLLQKWPC